MDFSFSDPTISLNVHLPQFFNKVYPTWATALNGYMSPTLSRATGGCLLQLYDVSGHLDGSASNHPPYGQYTWTLGGGGGTSLPSELSTCLSVHADFTGIPEHAIGERPRGRHRGRIFIGPMAQSALTQDSTSHRGTVAAQVRETLAAAAADLLTLEPSWSVWSRKDSLMRAIVGGFIDDAWDIQRRRGEEPNTRTFFP